jgi:hypothetical protein
VKRNTTVARVTPTEAGAGRIRNLKTEIALVPVNSPHHHALSTAIRIEASKYAKPSTPGKPRGLTTQECSRLLGRGGSGAHPRRENRSRSPAAGYATAVAPTLGAEHKTMPISSWLFIRDRESIWIERPCGLSVIVAGPGSARAHLVFQNEDALQGYQVAAAERLTRAGWFLWGFDEQRRSAANEWRHRPPLSIDLNRQSRRDHRDRSLVRDT